MKVDVLQQIHARTDSGRTWSVMEGTTVDVDQDDAEMVALIKVLESRGMVQVAGVDVEPIDPEGEGEGESEDEPEMVKAKAATVKASPTTKPAASRRSTDRK